MKRLRERELFLLLLGDFIVFYIALWATLVVRYLQFPNESTLDSHLLPFSILFLVWICLFYIAGLYDKQTLIYRSRLVFIIINAMVANVALAAVFFFFLLPVFGIAPKTNLLIYLGISSILIPLWRTLIYPLFLPRKRARALIVGEGKEVDELVSEVNGNSRYDFEFVRTMDFNSVSLVDAQERLTSIISENHISIIVADARRERIQPIVPLLYELSFVRGFTFVDFYKVYEEIFDRIPLSALSYSWFLEHLTRSSRLLYDFIKRAIDIVGAVVLGLVFSILFPFVYIAMKIEGKGPIFTTQERLGQYNKILQVYKLRTMTAIDRGAWEGETENKVTKVGKFLRLSSIDELPQMWNILKGDLSLIGPRNDIIELGKRLLQEVPYYAVRTMVRPGITGWAQTNQKYTPGNISPQSIEESKIRLMYDLYYIKNRSLLLDIMITLKTIAILLERLGTIFKRR